MQRTALLLPFSLALLLAHPAFALDAREVSWAELAPAPVAYQNPFEALTTEQSDGLAQINAGVTSLDGVVQSNAAIAEQTASASEELNAQAREMEVIVDELRALIHGTSAAGEPPRDIAAQPAARPEKKKGLTPARDDRNPDLEKVIPLDLEDYQTEEIEL